MNDLDFFFKKHQYNRIKTKDKNCKTKKTLKFKYNKFVITKYFHNICAIILKNYTL